jgi:hypothetical protein
MKISRDNYEIWFLDYLEGGLNEKGKEEVRLFLKNNPDLACQLDAFMPTLSMDPAISYPDKGRLKKALYDDPACFENTAIAAMEGDLSGEEQILFEEWLAKNPAQQKFVAQLKNCKLQPDFRISFPGRDRLKKKRVILNYWIQTASAAAILLLALLFFYPEKKSNVQVASLPDKTIVPQQDTPSGKTAAVSEPSKLKPVETISRQKPTKIRPRLIASTHELPDTVSGENLRLAPLEALRPKPCAVISTVQAPLDLALTKVSSPLFAASTEIPLSDFLDNKLQELKAEDPKEIITRQEVTIAGLRLFSRLPGKRLTGKKGADGRLKSISFNSQLLAFSIPVNR